MVSIRKRKRHVPIPDNVASIMKKFLQEAKNVQDGMNKLKLNPIVEKWVNEATENMKNVHHGLRAKDYPYDPETWGSMGRHKISENDSLVYRNYIKGGKHVRDTVSIYPFK